MKDSCSTTTTGLLHSSFSDAQTLMAVNAIYWNKSGRIMGGDAAYLDTIGSGKTVSFKIDALDAFPNVSKTEVYATP